MQLLKQLLQIQYKMFIDKIKSVEYSENETSRSPIK